MVESRCGTFEVLEGGDGCRFAGFGGFIVEFDYSGFARWGLIVVRIALGMCVVVVVEKESSARDGMFKGRYRAKSIVGRST